MWCGHTTDRLSSVRCAHPSPDEEEHGPQGRAGVLTVRGGQGG